LKSKKVIWILNQTAGTPNSGWGERHYYFAKKWIAKGYKVVIISGSYNHLFHTQPMVGSKTFTLEQQEPNLMFCWVKIPKYSGESIFKLWSMIVFAIKTMFLTPKLIGRPEVILVSSMPIFPMLSGWYLKKKYSVSKLIFEIRDLWPLTPMYLKGYSKWHPMIIMMRWLEKFGYRKADGIVSLLPNAAVYIDGISKDPSKFHWIPNGIDTNLLEKENIPVEYKRKITTDKFVIGYAGTMGMANALEYFTGASILLKDNDHIHFVLVGDGYLKEALQEQTKGQKNITFLPKIEKNKVQQLLSFFDVCFIGRNNTPLFDYGVSSNKYFDYMLAKKPVLVSSNMIKDPVQLSGCGITVHPESSEAIVEGILQLVDLSTNELDKFGVLGYEYVRKYHNFEYLSSQYLKLF
jgi:glycosyltransferase involved in cell wall biosynthesis